MSKQSLVRVATYDNPVFAHIARNKLKTANLPSFLDGEYHVAMDWMIANAVGGIKLLVAIEDRDRAIQILEESGDFQTGESTAQRRIMLANTVVQNVIHSRKSKGAQLISNQ